MKGPEHLKTEINQLIQNTIANPDQQPTKPPVEYNKLSLPTPETCTDIKVLSSLQREIHGPIPYFYQIKKMGLPARKTERPS